MKKPDLHPCIDKLVVKSAAVRENLPKLNIFKSYGPDSVHPKLLKPLSEDDGFVVSNFDNKSICRLC